MEQTDTDLFELISSHRLQLATQLEHLSPAQFERRSSCSDWTVREVLAHLVAGPKEGIRGLAKVIGRCGFDFHAANTELARRYATQSPGSLIDALRKGADNRFVPPGFGPLAPLSDVVIHTLDICAPLGVEHNVSKEAATATLNAATRKRMWMVNSGSALYGFQFRATDDGWQWGSGPTVAAPSAELAHVMWGRTDFVDLLDGDGASDFAAHLKERRMAA